MSLRLFQRVASYRCALDDHLFGNFQITRRFLAKSVDRSLLDRIQKMEGDVVVATSDYENVPIVAMNFMAKKNALSRSFVSALSNAVNKLETDSGVKFAIFCSLIPDVFCAGADLKERALVSDENTPALVGGLRSLFQRIYNLPFPTIAALDGAALGGGLELALACDIRFAGNLPRCQLGLVETHWALLPGAGGTQRLPRIIGVAKAKELMFAARRLTAREAADLGIVNAAVEPNEVPSEWSDKPGLYRTLCYAGELSTKGPVALRELKRAVNFGLSAGSLEAGLEVEGECYKILIPTKDRKEGMKAFIEKRLPSYCGQ